MQEDLKDQAEEVVDGVVEDAGPEPELKEAVDDYLPQELAVVDPNDRHEAMVVLDNHDVAALLQQVQSSALKKWVYDLPGVGEGLTIGATQDITQRMNWTGKCKIGLLPETLTVEKVMADQGYGDEPFWVATVFARDEVTGAMLPGSSMEPQRMKLTAQTAAKWRNKGKTVPDDLMVFDIFSRTKAIQKATRNALNAFIPEEIEQTVIAMFKNDPRRVERIQTEQEQKAAEMPPPLTDEKAQALIAQCEQLYDEIRELRGGQGALKFPPGLFASWMMQSQHSHERLQGFVDYLEKRKAEIPDELVRETQEAEARDTVNKVACPVCEQPANKFCKGIKGAHPERLQARLAQIQKAAGGNE